MNGNIIGKNNNELQIFETQNKFYSVDVFDGGVARINKDGYFGLMDTKGRVILEPKYDRIFDFFNGVAIVTRNNKYGIIDSKGKEFVTPSMKSIYDFEDSDISIYTSDVGNLVCGLLNKKGEIIELPNATMRIKKIGNQFLVISKDDQERFLDVYTLYSSKGVPMLSGKYGAFNLPDGYQHGILHPYLWNNSSIDYIIPNKGLNSHIKLNSFQPKEMEERTKELAFFFQEGLSIFPQIIDGQFKFCFVNTKGEEIIPPKYDRAHFFSFGMAAVMQNNKWGVINVKGETVIPFEYEYLEVLTEQYFLFKNKGKKGIINKSNKVIVQPEYSEIKHLNNDVFALLLYTPNINNNNKGFEIDKPIDTYQNWGILNIKTGLQILPYDYSHIRKINDEIYIGGRFKIKDIRHSIHTAIPHSYGLVTAIQSVINSKQIVYTHYCEPVEHDFSELPYIRTKSELELIKLSKSEVFLFTGKVWLDQAGQQLTDVKLIKKIEARFYLNHLKVFSNETEDKQGVKDIDGRIILKQEFDKVEICISGIIISKNGKYGFADLTGKIVIPMKFDNLKELASGCLATEVDFIDVLIDKKGNTLIE